MRPHDNHLEQRLRREKPEHSAPAGFTERLMSNLPAHARLHSPVARESSSQQLLWPRLATAFGLLAIAAVLLPELVSKKPTHSVSVVSNSSATEQTAVSISTDPLPLSTITHAQFQALTTKLDDPLQKELNNVISDTRIAIQFVASNFIPEK